jgi:hypothetical protein
MELNDCKSRPAVSWGLLWLANTAAASEQNEKTSAAVALALLLNKPVAAGVSHVWTNNTICERFHDTRAAVLSLYCLHGSAL